ncbi:MAG: S26 family signal peptidase [Pirellulaceae bacterium]
MVSQRRTVKRCRNFARFGQSESAVPQLMWPDAPPSDCIPHRRLSKKPSCISCPLVAVLPLLLASLPLACYCGCLGSAPAPQRYQVASSSMFPTLLGPTRQAKCAACQFEFPVAAETYRPELPTRCERCGGSCDVAAAVHPGQTAELEPLSFDGLAGQDPAHHLRRWDLIAFQEPPSGSTQVKRVWGLPGETIELRDGELWVDGELLRKSLSELRRLAVPVYDLKHSTSGLWWLSTMDEASQPARLSLKPGQIVRFQFCRPAPIHPSEVPAERWLEASPMVDSYSINQGLSTALHAVDDCLLSLRLSQPLHGELAIEMHLHERVIRVVLESAGEPLESRLSSPVNDAEPTSDTDQAVATWRIVGQMQIDVGRCDGRLLLESDLQSRVIEADELELAFSAAPNAPSTDTPWGSHELFRLDASVPLDITQLQLSRDLYLAPATHGSPNHESSNTPSGSLAGYYVLGDNLPVSLDSRQQFGRIPPSQVLGRIIPIPNTQRAYSGETADLDSRGWSVAEPSDSRAFSGGTADFDSRGWSVAEPSDSGPTPNADEENAQ